MLTSIRKLSSSYSNKRNLFVWLMCLVLAPSFVLAVMVGTVTIPFIDALNALFSVTPMTQTPSSAGALPDPSGLYENQQLYQQLYQQIVQQIRLPRALLAMFVGAILGICGATTQGLFRNPLADPSLIGVTAGASAGAALVIFFTHHLSSAGVSSASGSYLYTLNSLLGLSLVSLGAFIGGAVTVLLVYKLATNRHGTSVATMLLAGIAITAIAGGLTSLLEFFADNDMLRRISLWRMGGLDSANYTRAGLAGFTCVGMLCVLPKFSTALNALLLGESEARHLGIAVQAIKLRLIVFVAIGVGIAVAMAGTIGFVGLVVPHIIRLCTGPNHRFLLPMSAVGGAILVLLADTLARALFSPTELPVGLVTAFLGAPFFISLLRKRHEFGING